MSRIIEELCEKRKKSGVCEEIKTSLNDAIELEKGNTKLSSLFENYTGDYEPEEIDWGEPVGKEIW